MSSSLSDVPSHVSPWQISRIDRALGQLQNNGESSRHAQARRSLPGPSERAASLSPSRRRHLKRAREDTPRLADEAARSTSTEQIRQNASVPSFGPLTGTAEDLTTSNDSAPRVEAIKAGDQASEDYEGGDSHLFSERTQPLPSGEGDEEDDFLPDTEGDGFEEQQDATIRIERDYTETIKDGTTSVTENLDNPISLEEGELFRLEEADDGMVDQPHAAKASDYLPRPFATATIVTQTDCPSLTVNGSIDSDQSRVPRLPTPVDHMSRVIDQCLPYQTVQLDEGYAEEEDDEELDVLRSYHSNDTSLYEMDHRPVLERTAVKRDIREFVHGLDCMREEAAYKVVDRLGEGTFSSVYLAYDLEHQERDNTYWLDAATATDLDKGNLSFPRVALKKIVATSSPARIHNELQILENLRGCRNVSQIITAFREDDQVIVVLPYHQSDDFRYFYRHMDALHTQMYMRSLFEALKDTHARGIIHRDVKPANFLFDYESCTGVLCDFGLAERYSPPRKSSCQHAPATLGSLHGSKQTTSDTSTVEQAFYDARKKAKLGEGRVGFLQEDKRAAIKTNRAGTRGFRAPEVLLKCPDQTVAIDVWSAGVMLLSILTHKFPVFNSNDDIEALMEIAAIYGRASMERCAMLHNRTIICNVPTIDSHPNSIKQLILNLNPHIYTPPLTHPTAEDAREHIEAMDQAMDLCARLLRLDSTKRATAAQALKHPFLAERDGEAEEQVLDGTKGKCGDLHGYDEHGRHQAFFGKTLVDMPFGMGVPTSTDQLCPEHHHFQERHSCNPLAASRRFPDREEPRLEPEPEPVESPEKIFKRDPPPSSTETSTFKREVLARISQNKSMSAGNTAVLKGKAGPGGTVAALSGLSGLSRFVSKDKEKEEGGFRAAARPRLV